MRSCSAVLVATILFNLLVGSAVAVSAQEYEVDPNVTLDSVVQIGDGPQELSTDIKFYPNTRSAKPADTVYWMLNLADLECPVPEWC